MSDAFTVFRKELLEMTGDRHSFRGALLQALLTIVITGILVPVTHAAMWQSVSTVLMLYVVFPSTLAATIAADAFAGESERKTIETLLATSLDDRAIFLGKASVAVVFVICVSAAALSAGLLTSTVSASFPTFSPLLVPGVLAGATAGAFFVAAVAVAISVRVTVARSAQQMGSLLTFAAAGGAASLIRRFGGQLAWPVVIRADVIIFALGLAGLAFAMKTFRRDRFFEQR